MRSLTLARPGALGRGPSGAGPSVRPPLCPGPGSPCGHVLLAGWWLLATSQHMAAGGPCAQGHILLASADLLESRSPPQAAVLCQGGGLGFCREHAWTLSVKKGPWGFLCCVPRTRGLQPPQCRQRPQGTSPWKDGQDGLAPPTAQCLEQTGERGGRAGQARVTLPVQHGPEGWRCQEARRC